MMCCDLLTRTDVVNEALDLRLHAPVAELHLTQFIGTHDGGLPWVIVVLFDPVVPQRAPLGFQRLVEPRVLLGFVLVSGDGVCHDVDGI